MNTDERAMARVVIPGASLGSPPDPDADPEAGTEDARQDGKREPTLAARLRERIRVSGPMTFAEFMEAALYDAHEGFYTHPPIGEHGAFVTAPHIAPAFGVLIARQLGFMWDLLERPEPFRVIEAGAGDGTLARQILSALPEDLSRITAYTAVDRSPGARESLARLAGTHPMAAAFSIAADIGASPRGTGCIVANELLDNLPFHRLRGTTEGTVELYVRTEGDGFALEKGPLSGPVRDLVQRLPKPLPPGREAVVSPAANAFLSAAVGTLDRGYILLVDYAIGSDPPSAMVHGYRRHRVEEDVLNDPGSRDITAGVDFGSLARHAGDLGAQAWGPISQRDLLLGLGFRDWDRAWRDQQVHAAAERRGIEAMRIYSMRSRATLLVDPAGLGAFQVLCLGIGGVPRPETIAARD